MIIEGKTFEIRRLFETGVVHPGLIINDRFYLCYQGFKPITGFALRSGQKKKFRLVEVK